MSRRARLRRRGFWRGIVTGMALAVLAGLVLALAFPSFLFMPPELEVGVAVPPDRPLRPGPGESPAPPRAVDRPSAPGSGTPLIDAAPPADLPPDLADLAPPPAPDVFLGGPAGSPSLVAPSLPPSGR